MVADPNVGPTAEELVRLEQRCAQACADEWRGDPAISATCNSAGAFLPPIAYDKNVAGALDVVVSERQKGEGLFGASTLSCNLGTTCCEAFAVGMHEKATTTIGFPAGGMMLDTAFDVDAEHFLAHRPLGSDTYVSAQLEDFTADNLDIAMTVPCPSGSRASFTTRLLLYDPNDGSALDRPPSVTNDLPSQVPCNGNPTPLTATASDVDNDLAEVRWLVDDVLIAS